MAQNLGSEHRPLALGNVWRVAEHRVKLVGHAVEQVGAQPPHGQPEPLTVGAREFERGFADVAAGDLEIGPLVCERERNRATTCPHIKHARVRR